MDSIYSQQGDSLDLICYRHYGYTGGVTEAVLKANPGLADLGPQLPIGTKINLPIYQQKPTANTVKLWD